MLKYIGIYLLAINVIGMAIMGVDKSKARRGTRRIPEKTLFTIAAIGGSVGTTLGMYAFRHKTKHITFVLGMPVILVAQVAGVLLIFGQ